MGDDLLWARPVNDRMAFSFDHRYTTHVILFAFWLYVLSFRTMSCHVRQVFREDVVIVMVVNDDMHGAAEVVHVPFFDITHTLVTSTL